MAWPTFSLFAAAGVVALLYQIYFYSYSNNSNTYSSSQSSNDFRRSSHDNWETYENECSNYKRKQRRRRGQGNIFQCPICVGNLEDNVRELSCGHKFHTHCIKQWIQTNQPRVASCPMCRKPINCS